MLGRYVMGCRFLAEGKGQGGGNMEHGNLGFLFSWRDAELHLWRFFGGGHIGRSAEINWAARYGRYGRYLR